MGMGVLGLFYGAVTAEFKIAEEDARAQGQYQKETAKDLQLEAAIEQELDRQRAFEGQIAGTTGNSDREDEPETRMSRLSRLVTPSAGNPGSIVPASFKPVEPSAVSTPFKNVEVKDLNKDGIADLWIYYHPQNPGEVLRQEKASKLDGRVDTWSYFREGKLVRRDIDNHGHGRPDTVYYYDEQKMVREERDEAGEGRITYRADYRDGRVARVERATRGSGRTDVWITYDTSKDGEIVLKEERDLDGDGLPDLWSHYSDGRLVRRDLNNVGIELLSKQDGVGMQKNDLRWISLPGN
jgi:hypothetical protein